MSELEDALESVDKSTVFRTLSLFAARHLLHEIEDGSGSTKYCICRNDRPCGIRRTALPFPREAAAKPSVWTTRISPPYAIPPASRYGRSTTCSKVCAPTAARNGMYDPVRRPPSVCNRVARISRYICLRKPTSSPRPFRTDGLDKKERYSEKSMTAGKFFVPLLR